ncbi:TetR family transcriptional regulator [Mycobacterium sp. 852013-50091_SCH5140682]|uniref:TetR/AcrR family transcriptional regulator n=1 Tax=Mycobacterium sp. 852013-50091_SCH5140682 TaxID=1834109 RepID=UPI0007EB5FF5|nr:TetR/AcrR family transcriptional regulator [Mycobacterium sp. 852013-50091_SCH5140682]OBC17156.1 TetR family transcriptional regulator [Mycobacterium sp. 852013-50091_SCH5140682]
MGAKSAVTDRRQSIIDAARHLFATRPYDRVTTSEIAKNAGVAYGLIAHHFENKRGLYLAVMNEIAEEIAAVQLSLPPADTALVDQLRHALRSHIAYIDSYSGSFVALLRGALGADAEHQAAVERLRWIGAQRILLALGIADPIPPVLRAAMHGWVGYLDEMMIDRITHRDIDADALVELAAAALVTTLKTTAAIEPSIVYSPEVLDAFESFG